MPKRRDPIVLTSTVCYWHRPRSSTHGGDLGYISHAAWMESEVKRGEKKRRCPDCKLYLFPSEWGTPVAKNGRSDDASR